MTRRAQEVWTRLLEERLIPQSEVHTTRARTRIVIVTVPGVGWWGQGQPTSGGLSACRILPLSLHSVPHPGVPARPGIWYPYSGLPCAQSLQALSCSVNPIISHGRKVGKHSSSMRNPHAMTQHTSWQPAEHLFSSHIKTGNTWKDHLESSLRILLLPSAVFHSFKLK